MCWTNFPTCVLLKGIHSMTLPLLCFTMDMVSYSDSRCHVSGRYIQARKFNFGLTTNSFPFSRFSHIHYRSQPFSVSILPHSQIKYLLVNLRKWFCVGMFAVMPSAFRFQMTSKSCDIIFVILPFFTLKTLKKNLKKNLKKKLLKKHWHLWWLNVKNVKV